MHEPVSFFIQGVHFDQHLRAYPARFEIRIFLSTTGVHGLVSAKKCLSIHDLCVKRAAQRGHWMITAHMSRFAKHRNRTGSKSAEIDMEAVSSSSQLRSERKLGFETVSIPACNPFPPVNRDQKLKVAENSS